MLRFSVRVGESNDYWPKAQAENSFLYFYSGHLFVHLFSFLWHLTRTDGKALPAKLVNLKYLKDIYSPHKVSSVEQTLTFLSFFVHRQRALILEHYYIRYSPTCALLCIEVYLQCTLKAMCIFSMHRYFCRKIIMIFIFFYSQKGETFVTFC